jgi:hypothetical protein
MSRYTVKRTKKGQSTNTYTITTPNQTHLATIEVAKSSEGMRMIRWLEAAPGYDGVMDVITNSQILHRAEPEDNTDE